MTLEELLELCANSSPDDWNTVGHPSYLNRFLPVESRRDGTEGLTYELQHEEHPMRAAYKPDLLIGIGWGMDVRPSLGGERHRFEEDWATNFPDPEASFQYVDFLYGGAIVQRQHFVRVDSRCSLPLPEKEVEGEGSDVKVTALKITPWQRDFFRVLNALETSVDYDSYLERAGFQVID